MTIYQNIAKDALINWNGKSIEEANQIVQSQSVQELEGQVYAMGTIGHAVEGIAKELGLNYFEKQQLLKTITDGPEDAEIIKSVTEKAKGLSDEQQLNILSVIHDGWVKDNSDQKTIDKKVTRNQLHQYLPLELIGWKEVKSDLLFLKPILDAIDVKLDENELHNSYLNRTSYYMTKNNISFNKDTLQSFIITDILSDKKVTRYKPLDRQVANQLWIIDAEEVIDNYGNDKEVLNKVSKENSVTKMVENGFSSKYFDVKHDSKYDSLLFDLATADLTRENSNLMLLNSNFLNILKNCKNKEELDSLNNIMIQLAELGGLATTFYNDVKPLITENKTSDIEDQINYVNNVRLKAVSKVITNGIESKYYNVKFRPGHNNSALNTECDNIISNMVFADISRENRDYNMLMSSFGNALSLCKTKEELYDLSSFMNILADIGGIAITVNNEVQSLINKQIEKTPFYGIVDDKYNMTMDERTNDVRKNELVSDNSDTKKKEAADELVRKIDRFVYEASVIGTREFDNNLTPEYLDTILLRLKNQLDEYSTVIGQVKYDDLLNDIRKARKRVEQYQNLEESVQRINAM